MPELSNDPTNDLAVDAADMARATGCGCTDVADVPQPIVDASPEDPYPT